MAGGWMRWLSGKTLRKCIAWAKFFQAGHKPFLVTLKMHNVTTNTIYKYSWFVNSKVMEQLCTLEALQNSTCFKPWYFI